MCNNVIIRIQIPNAAIMISFFTWNCDR